MGKLNLRRIETRGWKAMQQNGLFDLYFGIIILVNAAVALIDELSGSSLLRVGVMLALYSAAILSFEFARRRYVTPRVGAVRFAGPRVHRVRLMRIILAVSAIVTCALVVVTATRGFTPFRWMAPLGDYGPSFLIALVILVPLSALSILLAYPRMWIHGALFVAGEFILATLSKTTSIPALGALVWGAVGLVSLSIGITVFTRFLRSMPRINMPPREAEEGSGNATSALSDPKE